MEERLELIIAERKKTGGLSVSVIISFLLHGLLLWWFLSAYKPAPPAAENVPMARYVQLITQNPDRQFVEAPGPKIDKKSMNAPLSDANRRASTPEPTGLTPTKRPGDGGGLFNPPRGQENARPAQQQPQNAQPQRRPSAPQMASANPYPVSQSPLNPATSNDAFQYRETTKASAMQSAPQGAIDWKSAIREAARGTTIGRNDGVDGPLGGEKGLAEQGPLSFETQWYDWGDYAQSMVSRIRVNWYANMPPLFKSGIPGVVTIRFTIHRDGSISDVTILKTSGHPPYDQAAKKAIEQSSPLKALPADFPNPTERVTCMFYYNMSIPES